MSASTMPTRSPWPASARARFTVTDDLPTPPLPLAMAYTFVSEPGWATGISRWARPSLRISLRPARCSAVITPRVRSTDATPGTFVTAAVTSRLMVSLSGQPATVSSTWTATEPSSATSTVSTTPSSVIGRLISGSLTVARASITCCCVGVLMMGKSTSHPVGSRSRLVLRLAARQVLDVTQQAAELRAEEVAGGDLADRHPQRGDLAGQELHVGVGAGVGLAVLLGDHLVALLLAVLGEQDQRGGVGRLQAEHERQEDERELVEAQVCGGQHVPADPGGDKHRHPEQELRGAHVAGERLGEHAERVGVDRRPAHDLAPGLARGVEAGPAVGAHPALPALGPPLIRPGRGARSRQPSGSMWSSRSSTVTAPIRRPSSSTTGAATRLYVARWAATWSRDASGRNGSIDSSSAAATSVEGGSRSSRWMCAAPRSLPVGVSRGWRQT